jgi:hypothetical protein
MDSVGQDQRLSVDLESSFFRIIDEALTNYLSGRPDRVAIRLDWSDDLVEARVSAERDPTKAMADAADHVAAVTRAAHPEGRELPPALESMMADRRERAEEAAAAAREASIVTLPASAWREIEQRALTTGISAELLDGGATLLLRADVGAASDAPADPA